MNQSECLDPVIFFIDLSLLFIVDLLLIVSTAVKKRTGGVRLRSLSVWRLHLVVDLVYYTRVEKQSTVRHEDEVWRCCGVGIRKKH